ncbi:MAG TPA: hypothetical protein VGM84_27295 [Steroidobacteraceae bacterium]|jgi:hypothetical protein
MNPNWRFSIPVLCALVAVGCSYDPDFEPARPAQLPEAAVYAGTERRGDWATCVPGEGSQITCTLYDPATGRAQFEKSLLMCPHLKSIGGWEASHPKPKRFDGQQVTFADVPAFINKPDRYLPAPGDSPAVIQRYQEQSEKVYKKYGVTDDCTPVADSKR